MPSCTICGVSFGTRNQVRGHIQGSAGEHAGIGFHDAGEYISDAPVSDAPEQDAPAEPPAESADEPSPSKPDDEEGLGVPSNVERPTDDDDPRCPECGSNQWFDASEVTDYQYGCAECSDGNSWQVFNA